MEEVKSIDWFMSEIDRAMDILEQNPDVKKHADEQRRPMEEKKMKTGDMAYYLFERPDGIWEFTTDEIVGSIPVINAYNFRYRPEPVPIDNVYPDVIQVCKEQLKRNNLILSKRYNILNTERG